MVDDKQSKIVSAIINQNDKVFIIDIVLVETIWGLIAPEGVGRNSCFFTIFKICFEFFHLDRGEPIFEVRLEEDTNFTHSANDPSCSSVAFS